MTRAYVRPHDRRRARGAAARRAPHGGGDARRGGNVPRRRGRLARRGGKPARRGGRPARRRVPPRGPRGLPAARPHRPRPGRRPDAAPRHAPRAAPSCCAPISGACAPPPGARGSSATASRFSGTYATVAGKRRAHSVDATRAVLRFAAGERLELAVADDGVAFKLTGFASQAVRYRPVDGARGWLQRLTKGYEGKYQAVVPRRRAARDRLPGAARATAATPTRC